MPEPTPPRPTPPRLTPAELAFLRSAFEHARRGDVAALVAQLDVGLPADLTNDAGDTLLVLAAYHQQPEVVRLLLDRGADHARVNDRGQTALGAAVFRRHAGTVTALLDAGADPHLGGRSAVDVATFFELPEMLDLLLR